MMAAGRHTITVEAGATFTLDLTWSDEAGVPFDLSGYTGRFQIRRKGDVATGTDLGTVVLGADGTVLVTVPAATTAGLRVGDNVYGLDLTAPDGTVTRLLEGKATVRQDVVS